MRERGGGLREERDLGGSYLDKYKTLCVYMMRHVSRNLHAVTVIVNEESYGERGENE